MLRVRAYIQGVVVAAVMGIAVTGCTGIFDDKVEVSEVARNKALGSARVLHEATAGTQGETSYEIFIAVLDVDAPNSNAALRKHSLSLQSAGWKTYEPPEEEGLVTAHSDDFEAVATLETMPHYLAATHTGSERQVFETIKNEFSRRSGLLVLVVEPQTVGQ